MRLTPRRALDYIISFAITLKRRRQVLIFLLFSFRNSCLEIENLLVCRVSTCIRLLRCIFSGKQQGQRNGKRASDTLKTHRMYNPLYVSGRY